MKTIVIKTQKELDDLPEKFDEFTYIEIMPSDTWIQVGLARGNSRVEARGNSRVIARGNSRVDCYLTSVVFVFSALVVLNKILDNASIIYKIKDAKRPIELGEKVKITEYEDLITPTFEEWLRRGIVYADGIYSNLISQKHENGLDIFEVETNFKKGFVVKRGDIFSHGETESEAILDLKFKTESRDLSQFKEWKVDDVKTKEDLIFAYRCITGACRQGVKDFINSKQIPNEMKISDVIKITQDHYGHEDFKNFFGVKV